MIPCCMGSIVLLLLLILIVLFVIGLNLSPKEKRPSAREWLFDQVPEPRVCVQCGEWLANCQCKENSP